MKICENSIISRLSLGIAFVLGSAISAESAIVPAFTVTGSSFLAPDSEFFTTAMQFNVLEPINITAIGVYRIGADGSLVAGGVGERKVSLWLADGTPIDLNPDPAEVSLFIGESTPNAFSDNDFLYVPINQPLAPATYRIGTFIQATDTGIPAGDNAIFLTPDVGIGSAIT